MKKSIFSSVFLVAAMMMSTATGFAATRQFNIHGAVRELDVEGWKVTHVVKEGPMKLVCTGSDELIKNLSVTKHGDELKIRTNPIKNRDLSNKTDGKIVIYGPAITDISAEAGAMVNVEGTIMSNNGEVILSAESGSAINVSEIKGANMLKTDAETSAAIQVKTATANIVYAEAETGGAITFGTVNAKKAHFEAENGAAINVSGGAITHVQAEAETAGVVTLKGVKADSVQKRTEMGGIVTVK